MPPPILLTWSPTWHCPNYGRAGQPSEHCPYCWFGHAAGRLTIDGELGAVEDREDLEVVAAFLLRNRAALGDVVDLAGAGEPLVRDGLPLVLAELARCNFGWTMTTNARLTRPLRALEHALPTCRHITVSLHSYQAAEWREVADNVHYLRGWPGRPYGLSGTIVVSRHTRPILADLLRAAHSLSLDRLDFHLDDHDRQQAAELLAAARTVLPAGARLVMHGYHPPPGVLCDQAGTYLVLAPSGLVYPCLAKATRDIEPLGHVSTLTLPLTALPRACSLACPYSCDHRKHLAPVAPPIPLL